MLIPLRGKEWQDARYLEFEETQGKPWSGKIDQVMDFGIGDENFDDAMANQSKMLMWGDQGRLLSDVSATTNVVNKPISTGSFTATCLSIVFLSFKYSCLLRDLFTSHCI
jgi:hypothetical protein